MKRWVLVPIMEQHSFVAPGLAVAEEVPLILVTGNFDCLEQTGHFVAEADPILMGEEAGKSLVMLPLICDLHTIHLDDKSLALDLVRP